MKYLFVGAGLALAIAGCSESAQSVEGEPNAAKAAEEVAPTTEKAEAAADVLIADNGRVILSGPVSSLALDVDPVMVVMAPDGADREAFLELTPEAADTLSRTFEGVGSSVAFDCKPQGLFDTEEGTYDTFNDCQLASEGAGLR